MYIIIHETTAAGLAGILRSGFIFKSSDCQKLKLSSCQGNVNRRLALDPRVSLSDPNWSDKFDEVDGVYFRLLPVDTPVKAVYGGTCVLVFDKQLLHECSFVFNTEENFGFCIAEDGIEKKSQFSGEPGITVSNPDQIHLVQNYHFDPYASEICMLNNVSINALKTVFVERSELSDSLIALARKRNTQLFAL